ncbi:peroxiredoxin [Tenacibaculum holothuriorum]|uniref:Peroxiredoxin n=1 Tax=Tenacibaculum holothuriorum TaxID=1635173 RepID=A0A1Y2PHC0_9FLAO|nr:OsmC family protein [Tenacibaculum holothuriorum]OSY89187.1 peroxiredoxin [Tenacibaculum holothuriorum]
MKQHHYKATIEWTGNLGNDTSKYDVYSRNHTIKTENKAIIEASSDPAFLGDNTRYNPEELLLPSLSSCHMLWYLHLCTVNKINVVSYLDKPEGVMNEDKNGSGKFSSVTLNPEILIRKTENIEKAIELHKKANEMCFIANSCNFTITHKPIVTTK